MELKMAYYFNTPDQINGDIAYNRQDYRTALKHYKNALKPLEQYASAHRASPNSSSTSSAYYALAYVLSEIIETQCCILNQKGSEDEDFKKAQTLEGKMRAEMARAKMIVTASLSGTQKKELKLKLKNLEQHVLNSLLIVYWNHVSYLIQADARSGSEPLKSALKDIDTYFSILKELTKIDDVIRTDEKNQGLKLRDGLHKLLSNHYATKSEKVERTIAERVKTIQKAIKFNQLALKDHKKVLPKEDHIAYHLNHLKLQKKCFKLNNESAHLHAITDYIRLHDLNRTFSPHIQQEIKGYQFLVANQDEKSIEEAKLLAKAIIDLGEVPAEDNLALNKLYKKACHFLQKQSSAIKQPAPLSIDKSEQNISHRDPRKRIIAPIESHANQAASQEKNKRKWEQTEDSIQHHSSEAGFFSTAQKREAKIAKMDNIDIPAYQNNFDRLILVLSRIQLNQDMIAKILSITADFHSSKPHSATITIIQSELYEQAIALSSNELRVLIAEQKKKLHEKNTSLFNGRARFVKDEHIPLESLKSHQQLLNSFTRFFEDHLIQITIVNNNPEYINQLFGHLFDRLKKHAILPPNEVQHLVAQCTNEASTPKPLI